jgi:hypothetical protein
MVAGGSAAGPIDGRESSHLYWHPEDRTRASQIAKQRGGEQKTLRKRRTMTMQTVLNVPDALTERARRAGLLDRQEILRLLDDELRRRDLAKESMLLLSQVAELERSERVQRSDYRG